MTRAVVSSVALAALLALALVVPQEIGAAPIRCFNRPINAYPSTPGDDDILGRIGRDVAHGRGGTDRIFGLSGNDRLCGGVGDDRIDAGDGYDRIRGGRGYDVCLNGERVFGCEEFGLLVALRPGR